MILGYSLPLVFARLFGVPLFVLGVVFLFYYRRHDDPKAALRRALRTPWVWFFLVLAWVAFGFEIAYLAKQA